MKLVVAVIQPFKLDETYAALLEIPQFPGLTISRVEGFGQGRARARAAGQESIRDFAHKTKLECAVPDAMASIVMDTILRHAHTGNPGDGKVFVLDLPCAVRIRTGEHDNECLWSPTGR